MGWLWYLLDVLQVLLGPFEPLFKLVSFVIGPIIAIVAFLLGRQDRKQLIKQAAQLGQVQQQASAARAAAEKARNEADQRAIQATTLRNELEGLTKGSDQLWKLRPARPFPEYRAWYLERNGAITLTIGNLKGGVGKTTLAANFAAYVSETLHKRVLLVDLDYQGSLSNLMLQALATEEVGPNINFLFGPNSGLAGVLKARIHLVPLSDDVTSRLTHAWLVPASYEYGAVENQLLLSWLLNKDQEIDVRYRLSHALLRPEVRFDYDVMIFDMPPRMTLGAINAIVASHFLFVPSVLDKLSVEAIPQFLTNVRAIKEDLDLGIELAGIVGTLTRSDALSSNEQLYLDKAREGGHVWTKDRDFILPRTVPRRAAIADAAGQEVAYLLSNN